MYCMYVLSNVLPPTTYLNVYFYCVIRYADSQFIIKYLYLDNVLDVLSSTMAQLRRCRVNAALTIQLFSQLFHFINMWLFNKLVLEPQLRLCTRNWGHLFKRRIGRIEKWAEKQGLELAAECHLARIIQVCFCHICSVIFNGSCIMHKVYYTKHILVL